MRTRRVIPPGDKHRTALRCYDFIAGKGKRPEAVVAAAEAVLGLKLQHHGDFEQHGYVYMERRHGATHVVVGLYEACDNPDCRAGHGATRDIDGEIERPMVRYLRAPDPTPEQLRALKQAIGEHETLKLTDESDDALYRLRFGMSKADREREVALSVAAADLVNAEIAARESGTPKEGRGPRA